MIQVVKQPIDNYGSKTADNFSPNARKNENSGSLGNGASLHFPGRGVLENGRCLQDLPSTFSYGTDSIWTVFLGAAKFNCGLKSYSIMLYYIKATCILVNVVIIKVVPLGM